MNARSHPGDTAPDYYHVEFVQMVASGGILLGPDALMVTYRKVASQPYFDGDTGQPIDGCRSKERSTALINRTQVSSTSLPYAAVLWRNTGVEIRSLPYTMCAFALGNGSTNL
jgi:hypothetical protein